MDFLKEYKGKYRLKSHIDQSTNDFPRNASGTIETDDVYIKCKQNCQIYHYGKDILVAYIPSIGRGHNILKSLGKELCNIEYNIDYCDYDYLYRALYNQGTILYIMENDEERGHNILKSLGKELCNIEYNIDYCDYDYLYRALYNQGTILYIMENDEEIEFRFYSKYIDLISKYLQTQISGASIDPFSVKNLPKSNYKIPLGDIETYKNIIVSVENKLLISRITQDFICKIIGKDAKFKEKNMSQEMKKQMLRAKEFIHSNGYWKQYIIYLQEEINNEKSCKI